MSFSHSQSAVPEDPHEKNPARGGAPAASPAASAGGGGAGVGKGGAPAMRSTSGGRGGQMFTFQMFN